MADKFRLTHLSTGDAFREAIQSQTELGKEIKGFVAAGKLVPDDLVSRVVFEKIGSLNNAGFLLDGYPRTVDQAKALNGYALKKKFIIDAVIFFDVAFSELVKRLSARRQCPSCKEVYNLVNKPPKVTGVCDKCSAKLIHRPDDRAEIVEERLSVYTRQTEPVLDYYKEFSGFKKVNAAQPIEQVAKDIEAALKN